MQCARHPQVDTLLTCVTCGTPICPDCMVETPVGMKCPECGRAPLPAVLRITPGAVAAASVTGAALGALAGALVLAVGGGFGLISLFLGPIVGGAVGEAASRAAGGKRGQRMGLVIAAATAAGILLLAPVVLGLLYGASLPVEAIPGLLVRRPIYLLFGGLAAVSAFWRVR